MAACFVDRSHDLGGRVRQDERERDVLEYVPGRDSAWRHFGCLRPVLLRPQPVFSQQGQGGSRDTWVLWGKIVLGCIPAAAIGLPLNDWMEEHFYNAPVVALALIVYGVLFIVIENWRANKRDQAALAGSFGSRAWWRADAPLVRILPLPLRLPLQTMTITWTLAPSLRSRI